MDEYGNFIVTWVSTGQAYSWFNDIKAQVYDYRGFLLGDEFQVNTADLPGDGLASGLWGGSEVNPTVAMDSLGHVVFAWELIEEQSNGVVLDSSIMARRFVLQWNYMFPTVIDYPYFDYLKYPDSVNYDPPSSNPAVPNWFVAEQFIYPIDLIEFYASSGILLVDDGTHLDPQNPTAGGNPNESDIRRTARNPQVAMDKYGNFTVVWESFRDNDAEAGQAESYGIYYNRFSWTGFLTGPDVQQANLVITVPEEPDTERIESSQSFDMLQVNPSIAIDADGDFSIVWNGNGAQPDPLEPQNWQLLGDHDDSGVFMRSFHAASYLGGVDLNNDGIPEWALDLDGDGDFEFWAPGSISSPVGTQSRVNHTTAGVQEHATIAMEPDGDSIVVWSGTGVGDENGIFVRHYDEAADTSGPIVTELRTADGALISDYDTLYNDRTVYVVFSEEVRRGKTAYNSAENVNNWAVLDGNGEEIPGAIQDTITFGYNTAWGKWVARVQFNADPVVLPLDGEYTLVARTQIQDIAGNAMARTGFRPGGTGDVYGIDWKFLRKYGVQNWYDGGDPYTPVPSLSGGMGFTGSVGCRAARRRLPTIWWIPTSESVRFRCIRLRWLPQSRTRTTRPPRRWRRSFSV